MTLKPKTSVKLRVINEDQDDEHHLDDFRSDSDENEFIDGTISSQITHEDFEEGQEFEHSKNLTRAMIS